MKRRAALLLYVSAIASLCSCTSTPKATPPLDWGYEKEAISVTLKGDPQLNLFQKSPHALVACLYQLRDPNAFNQFRTEPDGLTKLLECGRFDPGVATAKRMVIQPGQEVNESLDRAEGARYVGFVAGYYRLDKDRSARLYTIPSVEETKGFLSRTKLVKPGRLDMKLLLGPQEIQDVTEETEKP
ncbi:type VI secretion lipoprotein, VC_A0113 family [Geobacter metallireducens RCH3]|uniref:Type VI secretion system outer membrane lipoprotein TssJ n=1 Tax=Geobacter metallireducens (strain ATCC 53774 / DSM 7210 / GS-15) TaxID=269799 RepID=Q39QF1_GEOMG|nr:type VI secretion system lipoprotein TssJ [Geobacter metallireducens]ABB33523.1 type VI secretion system outer membrane lipoprotein TssJ [Geobacter metallireducens GS-15]EHP87630.1 type VI secretion lipoprotein, VC_A0113 family [Geobacter metallireducens RCH3]